MGSWRFKYVDMDQAWQTLSLVRQFPPCEHSFQVSIIIWRKNRVRWLHFGADSVYSLNERFQLAENIRFMRLLRRVLVFAICAMSIVMAFIVVVLLVKDPIIVDIVWRTSGLAAPLYVRITLTLLKRPYLASLSRVNAFNKPSRCIIGMCPESRNYVYLRDYSIFIFTISSKVTSPHK
jgi:hypothetical protein